MATDNPYYLIWAGGLNLGDTPGVFMNAQFAGLLLQLPISLTFVPDDVDYLSIVLVTTDVEVFGGKSHGIYWDWTPGEALGVRVGEIDDKEQVPGRKERHVISVPRHLATTGRHSITIVVNEEVAAGFKDDFVLVRIEASSSVGAKIGW